MIREIKRQAKETLAGRWGKAILVCFVVSLITGIISSIGSLGVAMPEINYNTMTEEEIFEALAQIVAGGGVLSTISSILSFLVAGALTFGTASFFIKWVRNEYAQIENIFDGFRNGYFVKTLLINVISGLLIALWTLLLIVPGIIKAIAYSQAYRIAYDHPEMSAMDCIRASEKMMYGHKMQYFLLILSFFGWFLLVAITFGIASLWLEPLMETSATVFYQTIKAETEPEYTENPTPAEA